MADNSMIFSNTLMQLGGEDFLRELTERSALKGERHGFAVPVLCMTGAPLYTQLHVYPASRQTPFHRR
ncbi:hypothetical protein WKI72_11900 [Candidatus Erwinia dacicola]